MNTADTETSTTTTDSPPVDKFADVASSHTLTAKERAALEPEPSAADVMDGTATATKTADKPAAVATKDDAATTTAAATDDTDDDDQTGQVGPSLLEVPQAPKDFDAELKTLRATRAEFRQNMAKYNEQKAKYDRNELDVEPVVPTFDEDAYEDKLIALQEEKSAFVSRKERIESTNADRITQFQTDAKKSFDDVAATWMTEHKDFMANPLRAKAMQDAITAIDEETKGKGKGLLPPAELFKRASKAAFEAFNWKPEVKKTDNAATLAARKPPEAPRTLGQVPAAGTDTGSKFDHLEGLDTIELERAVAKMKPAEREAWLREVDAPIS